MRCPAVQELYRSSLVCPLIPILKGLVQTAELYSPGKYVNWNLSFFNGKPMIAMENFSK